MAVNVNKPKIDLDSIWETIKVKYEVNDSMKENYFKVIEVVGNNPKDVINELKLCKNNVDQTINKLLKLKA